MYQNIIIAAAVVAAIGLVAGILLALASRFMGVEEDPRLRDVRECLPGANCGACGYAGCDSYAKAIVEEGAGTNLCVPGAASVAERVSAIVGVEAEAVEEKVAFVRCNGVFGAAEQKSVYEGIDSCKSANLLWGGQKACVYACLGFGDCALVCPSQAITVENGVARVERSLCIGCGLCERTCPKKIISLIPKNASVAVECSNIDKGISTRKDCKNGCIGCKKCEKVCPVGAITVVNNLSVIDYEKCTLCGECLKACPVHCIKHPGDKNEE